MPGGSRNLQSDGMGKLCPKNLVCARGGWRSSGCDRSDTGDDVLDRSQSADAFIAAGEFALGGIDELASVLFQLRDIALSRRVLPHFAVHRGGDQHRRAARQGEVDRGERIGRESVGELAEQIGRCRCEQQRS